MEILEGEGAKMIRGSYLKKVQGNFIYDKSVCIEHYFRMKKLTSKVPLWMKKIPTPNIITKYYQILILNDNTI